MASTESLIFDILARDNASSAFIRAGRSAKDAAGNVQSLNDRLTEIAKRSVDARVGLEGDKEANASLDKLQAKLIDIGGKTANPNIDLKGALTAETQMAALSAELDRLDGRRAEVTVDVNRGGLLSRLLGGGGGGLAGLLGGGAESGGAGGGGGQALLFGGGGLLAALLAPALIPTAIGGGVGAGAAGIAIEQGNKVLKQLTTLGNQIQSAKGAQKKALEQQAAVLRKEFAPELALAGSFKDLKTSILGVFATALAGPGAGGSPSFLTSLTGLMKQISGFVKSIGPDLGNLFRASVPYLKLFVQFGEQATKLVLPVFVQMLNQMKPFLPIIAKGLLSIVQGFAGFLKALGPTGMQASAELFLALTKLMEGALILFGVALNRLLVHVVQIAHDLRQTWDVLRHDTAVIFDAIKSGIAAAWNWIYSHSIGAVTHVVHDAEALFGNLHHGVVTIFDAIKSGIAAAWDTIWSNTIGRVKAGIGNVVGFFRKLPGEVASALLGLGTKLWNLGKTWLTDLWNGIKSVWNHVLGFFKNIPGDILHALGIHSPPDWAISAGKHIMEGLHIGLTGTIHKILGFTGTLGSLITRSIGDILPKGIPAGSKATGGAVGLGRALAAAMGWSGTQWDALYQLWERESGWNYRAENPSSGAYGIPQALPGSKMASAGADWRTDPATQIRWGLGYIAGRYGDPVNAWAHETRFGWYGSGFHGIVGRPTIMGVGERGAERVDITPLHRGGGGDNRTITLEFRTGPGANALDRAIIDVVQRYVIVHGGDVQTALGQPA